MPIQSSPYINDALILLVEDCEADARLVFESMNTSKLANKLIHVSNGELALDYLYQRGAYTKARIPDLILLDLNMPRMDGRELLEVIKNDTKLKNIPLIVLTTSNDNEDVLHSYDNLANCFITKPLDFNKFVEVIQTIEHFWLKVVSNVTI